MGAPFSGMTTNQYRVSLDSTSALVYLADPVCSHPVAASETWAAPGQRVFRVQCIHTASRGSANSMLQNSGVLQHTMPL